MYTGARVVVAGITPVLQIGDIFMLESERLQAHLRQRKILEDCPVGVASNDGGDTPVIVSRPFVEAFVHFVAEAGIRSGAGRVFYPTPLQIRPDMVDKELAHGGYGATAHRVGLVAVDHEDGIVQEDGFIDLNARKQGLVDVLMVLPVKVMIPPDLDVAGFFGIGVMELRQKFIDRRVGDVDLVE